MPPNVVIIMTDHTRGAAVRQGSPCLTPNLDALAGEGIRFHRAYTTNAICSPARASLMTGMYPSAHGVWDCTHTQRKEWVDVRNNPPFWSQRLAEAGYAGAYFGKWHVEQTNRPDRYGFGEYELCSTCQMKTFAQPRLAARTPGYKDALMAAVGDDSDGPAHHPAFDRGIDFIRRSAAAKRPFFCFVSAAEPHDPYIPPKRFLDLYDQARIATSPTLHASSPNDPPVIQRMRGVWKDITDQQWRFLTATYHAVISFMDQQAGRVIQTLRDCGVYDDTIIIFTSDHGDMLGGHGLFAKGMTPYEEVYNIPLIVRAPGVRGREDNQHLVSMVDLAPTILDLCGLGPMSTAQGRSLRPVLDGAAAQDDWQDAYAEFFGQRFVYTQRLVWHGKWKYVFSPAGWDELYDLAADPNEQHNLAGDAAHRDTLLDMTRRMWRRMKQIGDDSLYGTNYATLRLAPTGPQSAEEPSS